MKRSMAVGVAAMVCYAATVLVANWLIVHKGIVSVGFGLMAPAAVYAAGFAFTFRDVVQRTLGRGAAVVAILIGALLSLIVSTHFALASAAAFLISEVADFAVYTPLAERAERNHSERGWLGAVVASNVVGLVVDSWLFLMLAFGSTHFLAGQIVGKAWTTAAAVLVILAVRAGQRAVLPRHA